jgi:hypothetical protein
LTCIDGYYLDAISPSITECVQECPYGKEINLVSSSCIEISSCPDYKYFDSILGSCKDCDVSCLNCDGDT